MVKDCTISGIRAECSPTPRYSPSNGLRRPQATACAPDKKRSRRSSLVDMDPELCSISLWYQAFSSRPFQIPLTAL